MSQIIIVLSDNEAGGCAVDVEFCPPLTLPLTPAQQVASRVMQVLKDDYQAQSHDED